MRHLYLAASALLFSVLVSAPLHAQNRSILTGSTSPEGLAETIIPLDRWVPFPKAANREAWESLPAGLRAEYIERGERALDFEWPNLPATVYLEFSQTGNRSNYQRIRGRRRNALEDLVMAEVIEGKGRFLDQIVNGVWALCEETSWVIPAHLSLQESDEGLPDVEEQVVDLFAAETGALLAWTHYLLAPDLAEVSALVPERIISEIDRRILAPNLAREDFWWMGFPDRRVNNWNPWINSNWLTCILLTEQDPDERIAGIYKTMRSVDNFLNHYPDDGGCDEGPGYWNVAGGRLFDYLEYLRVASEGEIDYYDLPLIRNIGTFITKAHIHEEYLVNFADASGRGRIAGGLVYRYGKQVGDETMMEFGAWAIQRRDPLRRGLRGNIGRQMFSVFNLEEMLSAPASQPYLRDAWLPDIQVMYARSEEGSPNGWYVAAKGGHNAESHNHNDVGSFIVYRDGYPALIDVGVETYSRKTFSGDRYDIWTMQSAYHNLPTVNGVMQKAGRRFAASDVRYDVTHAYAELRQDISGAYPEEAGIERWERTVRLDRDRSVIVTDDYTLERQPDSLSFTLMTPYPVTVMDGELRLSGIPHREEKLVQFGIRYDKTQLTPVIEEIEIEDRRLTRVWGDTLYRILFKADAPLASDSVTITIVD